MNYTIRQAEFSDFDRIQEIYAYARAFMAGTGNPSQWGTSNPPRSRTEEDIRTRQLYVVTEGEVIHGVFFFSTGEDPTYKIIDGSWHADAPYGVIHRIAGDGSGGILKAALEFARKETNYLRIDTHRENAVMQRTLRKNGFIPCGVIYLANGDPRDAFDWME